MIGIKVITIGMIVVFFLGLYVIGKIVDRWNEWNQNR
jgi:hypothetical protein